MEFSRRSLGKCEIREERGTWETEEKRDVSLREANVFKKEEKKNHRLILLCMPFI